MTTPYQAAPDGAVTVGGGTWNYGQTLDETIGRQAFEFPMPNPGNMLELLRIALERLPLEALQPFADFLGFVDGVFKSVGEAVEAILNSLIIRPIVQTVEAFQEWVSNFFSTFNSGLVSGTLEDFAEWFDGNVIQPIVGTADGFIRGILGLIGNGFNFNVVEETAKGLADAIASMNAIVTELNRKAEGGGFTGTAVSVDFSTATPSSTLDSSKWLQTYSGGGSGTLGIASGRAKYLGSASNRSGMAIYTFKECVSDYQKIGAAFATLPSTNFLGGNRSYNYLYGRVNAAGNSYVYAKFGHGDLEVGCSVGGSITVLDTWTGFKFKPGVAYWLECGTNGENLRIFRVWENNRVIRTVPDWGSVSQVGNRRVGMGVTAFSDTYLPAEVSAFAFFDNTQPATKGSGFRRMRTSTANVSQPSGVNLIASNFFDTPDRKTEDITYVEGAGNNNNRVTVSVAGWYMITMKVRLAQDTLSVGGKAQPVLYVNGIVTQAGWESWFTGPSSWGGSDDTAATFVQYLNAGDYIQPGFSTNRAINLTGGPAGVQTNFSVVFLNNVRPT